MSRMYVLEPSNTPPVEIFPFLAYVPSFLAAWKRRAARVRKGMYDVYFRTLEAAKQRHANGEDRFSTLFSHMLRQRERGDKVSFTDSQLAFMGGGLLDGAIDTTLSSFESLVVCLTAHKDILKRAQAEVDEVCGDRMPNNNDIGKLLFLKACLMEVFRWRGAGNVGVPHCTTEDDVFEGYHIPKDTTVIACIYAIHLHEDDYEQPEVFNPDRFLANPYGVKYEVTEDEGRKETYAFSVGRRMCPGDDFAKMIILTSAAKLVWAFDFDTKDGKPPDLSWETGYRSGLTNPPEGFEPRLTPRTEERARVVEAAERSSEEYLSTWFG